jgi:AcrR family transcriptional regulator
MDPSTLTMQAVAERLGVDRKALNYHVTDRDGLLRLVAQDVLSEAAGTFTPPAADAGWPEAVRVCATALRDGMIRTGALFDYAQLPMPAGLQALEPAEHLARALLAAGFTEEDAGRALAFVGEFAYASAKDAVMTSMCGVHPQATELRRMLAEAPPSALPVIRRLSGRWPAADQFAFDLDVLIAGLSHRKTDPGSTVAEIP